MTTGLEIFNALFQVVDIVDACLDVVSIEFGPLTLASRYDNFTCKIASLCMSWPVQAGIISFSVVNSSFILDRRLRSIRLWAVLRAIFRPAALVALGCFFLPLAAGADDPLPDDSFAAFPVEPPPPADLPVGLCCVLGFI